MKKRKPVRRMSEVYRKEAGPLGFMGAPGETGGIGLEFSEHQVAALKPSSPFAVVQDEWTIRRGRELVAEGGTLESSGVDAKQSADFYAMAFEPEPEVNEDCSDRERLDYVKEVMGSPDFQALNEAVSSDALAAEFAALSFAQGYSSLVKAKKDQEERQPRPGERPLSEAEKEANAQTLSMRAASSAIQKATESASEINDLREAFGLGGSGGEAGKMGPARSANAFKRFMASETLRKIIERAGAFRRLSQSRRMRRAQHGQDEVIGIELGGEIGRLVPNELMALSGYEEAVELDAIRRLLERQSVQRSMKATEKVGRGPVVVVIDESGSMSGTKIESAKGLALAVAWTARKQGRWVALIGFSGNTEGNLIILPPGRWDESALIDWAEHFYGRGTTLDVPIKELPFRWWGRLMDEGASRGKTDVMIVTDAVVQVPKEDGAKFNQWRREETVRVSTLVIGDDPGEMPFVSDECHCVPAIDGSEEAVAKALDI